MASGTVQDALAWRAGRFRSRTQATALAFIPRQCRGTGHSQRPPAHVFELGVLLRPTPDRCVRDSNVPARLLPGVLLTYTAGVVFAKGMREVISGWMASNAFLNALLFGTGCFDGALMAVVLKIEELAACCALATSAE